jgi:hypothetical protein
MRAAVPQQNPEEDRTCAFWTAGRMLKQIVDGSASDSSALGMYLNRSLPLTGGEARLIPPATLSIPPLAGKSNDYPFSCQRKSSCGASASARNMYRQEWTAACDSYLWQHGISGIYPKTRKRRVLRVLRYRPGFLMPLYLLAGGKCQQKYVWWWFQKIRIFRSWV